MSRTRMTTLPFLLLALSSFVTFDSSYALVPCLLCKSNTLSNIFMMWNWTRGRFAYKTDNSGFLTFGVTSLCYI